MEFLRHFSEPLIYLTIFGITFAETGFIGAFFLPGDSLLFTVGMFAYDRIVSLHMVIIVLFAAAFLGNMLGYWTGKYVRNHYKTNRFLKKVPEKYIVQTEQFYQKYGALTVFFSRFLPVVRTVSPFFAGVSTMSFPLFLLLSAVGAAAWVIVVPLVGYHFGRFFDLAHVEYFGLGLMLLASLATPFFIKLIKRVSDTQTSA